MTSEDKLSVWKKDNQVNAEEQSAHGNHYMGLVLGISVSPVKKMAVRSAIQSSDLSQQTSRAAIPPRMIGAKVKSKAKTVLVP
jgi:hypothetical protein